MSVRLPALVVGDPDPRPKLSFRLSQGGDHVALMAKHSEDEHEQTLLEIRYHDTTGQLWCITRDIHAKHLAEVLGAPHKKGIQTRFVDKSS